MVTFFILAYILSWGSYYILSGPFLFPFGSVLAALLVAGVTRGKQGLKDLIGRCLRWRVGINWYASALFIPIGIALATVSLHILLGAPMPAAAQLGAWYNVLLLFPMALTDAPLWEESGWRGFAVPLFSTKRSRLSNTLILGLLLAGWHLPVALGGGFSVAAPYVIACIASAIVTNWVYYNADESALFAILYHTTANTMGIYLFQMFPEGDLIRLYWLLAAVNWIVAIIIIATSSTLRHKSGDEDVSYESNKLL